MATLTFTVMGGVAHLAPLVAVDLRAGVPSCGHTEVRA
jgi:hypothetical protein